MDRVWNNFIAGADAEPASGTYTDSFDPTIGAPFAKVADSRGEDVDRAVRSCSSAFAQWKAMRPLDRGRILTDIGRAIRDRRDEFGAIERAETGKPGWQLPFETEVAAQYFEFYGGLTNLFHGEVIGLGEGYHSYTLREPFGVVGVITPWNAPLNQAARGIAPALAAGNCVVSKPSEFTSGSTVLLARIAVECGMPAGVFNVVLGSGTEAGSALVSHPDIRKIAFTGSVRAGRAIAHIAADRIIPLTLELGGKSPNIVFEDADLSAAIPGAIRAFAGNAGQVCLAGSRLLVQRSIHAAFVEKLAAAVGQLKVGPDVDALMGPLTTKAQYDRVASFFDIARSEGLEPATGGSAVTREGWGGGWFLPPTVYGDVSNNSRLAREEIFGPVLVVIPFEDEDEAIAIANDTEYGLAAGIWTQSLSRAHRVSAAIQAGQIYVNEYMAGGVETPLGGYKNSGYGREKGIEALHHYTQLKCVTIKL
ncbi:MULTISPECIES: aldehyde dehydrogenase family protein [Sphingobium]|uniref:aldehyde dehydrogenase family protein n=1 Tax=Sphingobium TaxID=165695 RepID=UPI00159BF77A|nr:aldehyde dehydrogenase family protein [Sphingobium sp. 15-1]